MKSVTILRNFKRTFSTKLEKNVLNSNLADINIPKDSLSRFIWEKNVQNHGSRIALIDGSTKREYTFSEASQLAQNFGSSLVKRGYEKSNVLGIMLPNHPEYILAFTGAAGVGMTTTTFNPAYTSHEVSKQLNMSKAKIVMTNKALLPKMQEAVKMSGQNIQIIVIDQEKPTTEVWGLDELLKDDGSAYPKGDYEGFDFENDVVLLPYSSGTTGLPKGVMLTHCNLVSNTAQCLYPKGS